MDNDYKLALLQHLGYELTNEEKYEEIEEESNDEYTLDSETYRICTNSEADKAEDEYLDITLADLILPDVPDNLQFYFDKEKWKEDAKMDGRGTAIAGYDGVENEETINSEDYYLYRTN